MRSLSNKNRAVLCVLAGLTATAILFSGVALGDTPSTDKSETRKTSSIRTNNFYYTAFNKRDPFASLIAGDFIGEKQMSPLELGRAELVGVVKGDLDRFALLEDDKGFSYILRVGDQVKNGSVVAIGDRSMVASVTTFGQTRRVTLHMANREEGDLR